LRNNHHGSAKKPPHQNPVPKPRTCVLMFYMNSSTCKRIEKDSAIIFYANFQVDCHTKFGSESIVKLSNSCGVGDGADVLTSRPLVSLVGKSPSNCSPVLLARLFFLIHAERRLCGASGPSLIFWCSKFVKQVVIFPQAP
jgi:hypothetical protein